MTISCPPLHRVLPEPEVIVKRLFKVAEILSRKPSEEQNPHRDDENDLENQEDQEIGYPEARDRHMNS